ncbi:MAG: hypothetical protein C3F07_04415 [Anaerolineales bacterium]|nr:MAG: hypothetical protein C3F07_04415 [Anaerolineales bacterium]
MIKSFETKRGTIVIREANLADAGQFRELRLFALQESPLAFGQDYETSLDHSPEYWQERLRADDHSVTFVAQHEQTLIGMMGITRRPLPKARHSAKIIGVFVHPDWRGMRIADSMIGMCIEWARMHGVNILKLGVMSTNEPAIRCYERCGFTVYGKEPQAMFYEGQYYDAALMSRLL